MHEPAAPDRDGGAHVPAGLRCPPTPIEHAVSRVSALHAAVHLPVRLAEGATSGQPAPRGNLYLPTGVSYDYIPNWGIAHELGWWQPFPNYGEGKWGEQTPLVDCNWHWATFFKLENRRDTPPSGARGWVLVLLQSGTVKPVHLSLYPDKFSPDGQ